MARILRSKPVLIIGGGALVRRMLNNAQMKKRKRKRMRGNITGLVVASAAGGAIRYFTDSVSGSRRRQKIKRMLGKAEQGPEWTGTGGDSQNHLQLQDSTPSQS